MEKFIRITPNNGISMTLDDIKITMEALKIDTYLASQEYTHKERLHYHIYLKTDYTNERLRYQLKKLLSGQVYISGKDVIDKIQCLAYTIKDGNYIHNNIDILTLMSAKAKSFKKVTFEDELNNIQVRHSEKYVQDILEVYAKYNRKIYPQHIQAYIRSQFVKNDKAYRDRLAKFIYEDLLL